MEATVQLTCREETLKYRFLPVSENEVPEGFDFFSLTSRDENVLTEIVNETSFLPKASTREKTRIAYGFLFQLAGAAQITLDQIEKCNDDPIHINQISARKVAVYR
jgi:hypothetical protein